MASIAYEYISAQLTNIKITLGFRLVNSSCASQCFYSLLELLCKTEHEVLIIKVVFYTRQPPEIKMWKMNIPSLFLVVGK